MLGIAGRLRQHVAVLKLGYQEVLKRRKMGRQTHVGLVHVVASHPRSDVFFTCMDGYPQLLNCEPLDVKGKIPGSDVRQSQSCCYGVTVSSNPDKTAALRSTKVSFLHSCFLARKKKRWNQRRQPGSTMDFKLRPWPTKRFSSDPTSPRVYQYLVQFFERTLRAALSDEDINIVGQTFNFNYQTSQ